MYQNLDWITVKLQQTACDIMEAHQLIACVTTTYKEGRKNVADSGFSGIYTQSERMANAVASSVGMPQITDQQ